MAHFALLGPQQEYSAESQEDRHPLKDGSYAPAQGLFPADSHTSFPVGPSLPSVVQIQNMV